MELWINLFKSSVKFVTACILILLIPVNFILVLKPLTYRFLLCKLKPILRPSLGDMLSSLGYIMANSDTFNRPQSNVVVTSRIAGLLSEKRLKEKFTKNVLNTREENGSLLYPEFKSRLVFWGGYAFFEPLKDFSIEDHVQVHLVDKVENVIGEIRQTLLTEGWDLDKPLWKVHVIKDQDESVMFFTFHHCLGDGYSMAHIFVRRWCEYEYTCDSKPSKRKTEIRPTFCSRTFQFFKGWYDFTEYLLLPILEKGSRPQCLRRKEVYEPIVTYTGKSIPVSLMHDVKTKFGVSFSAVAMAILAGAYRKWFLRNGKKIPKKLSCASVLPIPFRSMKLRNMITLWFLHLPVGEPDAVKRLLTCHKNYENLVATKAPLILYWFGCLIACLPYYLPLSMNRTVLTGLSNLPIHCSTDPLFLCGLRIKEFSWVAGPNPGLHGISFSGGTYCQDYRIGITASTSVLRTVEELAEFSKFIQMEAQKLHQLGISHGETNGVKCVTGTSTNGNN